MRDRTLLIPAAYEQRAFQNIFRDVESRFAALEAPLKTYTVSNAGADVRTIDLSTATLADVKVFLGTLVQDLQNAGKLGKA